MGLCSFLFDKNLQQCALSTSAASIYHKIDAAWLIIHFYRDNNVYKGPSRRLAILAAAEDIAVQNGTGTVLEWRRAYWNELGARAASLALKLGFGLYMFLTLIDLNINN